MEIDLPEVVAEVREAFGRYEQALVSNDVQALNEFFRDDPRTIRYGTGEILYGYDEIKAFRAARSPVALGRTLSRTVITTFGRDLAVASTLYERPSAPGKTGRQMQTWVKFPEGWRVVAAHVSLIVAAVRRRELATMTSTAPRPPIPRSETAPAPGGRSSTACWADRRRWRTFSETRAAARP